MPGRLIPRIVALIPILATHKVPHKITPVHTVDLVPEEKRHAKHDWKNVLANTAEMMVHLGNTMPLTSEDIQMITARLSIGVAEKDITVSVDETEKLARCNPQSEFYVLPGSFHPLEKIRTALWASLITDFIER